jgi:hypothetical protein
VSCVLQIGQQPTRLKQGRLHNMCCEFLRVAKSEEKTVGKTVVEERRDGWEEICFAS